MPTRPDTPHDRPVKAPRWVSPWSFDDEWEDEQRRHAALTHPREPTPAITFGKEAQNPPAPNAKEPATATSVDTPLVSAKPVTAPAVVSIREEAPPPLAKPEATAPVTPPQGAPVPASAAPAQVAVVPQLEDRFRPPALRAGESSSAVEAVPNLPLPKATSPAAEVPRDPPTQKRPAPVPNSVRHRKQTSVFPWSTVFTTILGMAGLFLLGAIYFIDVPPVPDDDLALQAPVDTTPKIAGPERLATFLQAVNTLTDMELVLKPASKWEPVILQSFIQGNGAALDALRDLLGDFDWHPHHAAWHQEDFGQHRSWPHVRILLQARVAFLMRTGQEHAALDAVLDIGRLSSRLREMWSWPSYAHRAQELHMACVQTAAHLLKDTRLPSPALKAGQDEFFPLMPSDALMQGALSGFYLHEKKLLLGENSGEPLDTMPGGVLQERPGRLFFKKQETLGLFAHSSRLLRDQIVEAPFSTRSSTSPPWDRSRSSLWFQPNAAGQAYFIAHVAETSGLPRLHHLARTRHALVLSLFAVRRYLVDHQRLPSGLSDLLPNYLPELPLDPYSGEALHYDPLKGVLFSVGDDFQAQDGHVTEPPLTDAAEPTLEIGIAIATPVQAGP